MLIKHPAFYVLPFILLTAFSGHTEAQSAGRQEKTIEKKLSGWNNPVEGWKNIRLLKPDSLAFDRGSEMLEIYLPAAVALNPVREDDIDLLTASASELLGRKFRGYKISFFSGGKSLYDYIPNFYRFKTATDSGRIPVRLGARPVLLDRIDRPHPLLGLNNRYIALWHSHGYYFDMNLDRWEYQRAKLFGTVEDLSVMAYVVPYLVPLLENAGATVFLPRERDTRKEEVIVDNDTSTGKSKLTLDPGAGDWQHLPGFIMKDTIFDGENPFLMGSSMRSLSGNAEYVPDIPVTGDYALYISYPSVAGNSVKARYTVKHSGGTSDFIINQTLGGGTWIYLGTFRFISGCDAGQSSVRVSNEGDGLLALDAIRFGGGMGNVARRQSSQVIANQRSIEARDPGTGHSPSAETEVSSWKLSGKPRFVEGARYWLQYSGMPDTMVYSPTMGKNDYNDDYMSRSEWVNYLVRHDTSSPHPGLGIPLDLSLAFHTDAGVTPGDSIIGTLAIYSTASMEGKFPDGTSRLASRDLSDIVQTQVVEDIRALFNPSWTRRDLTDKLYYEARKPDVPALLLELLSHQNLADQRLGLDPRFRFSVSRAVYKGMLRYLSSLDGSEYMIEPLPVKGMSLTPAGGKKVILTWDPVTDPLEPTADPAWYMVYTRKGDGGFDNGSRTDSTSVTIELPSYDTIYSFRVTAVNEGGESFPSETLAAGFSTESLGTVMVINGFDRVSGPAWFDTGGMAGVEWWNDRGVADHYNFVTIGDQYDFYRKSEWTDDDNAGWGATYSDKAGDLIPGNSFDYPSVHGSSIMSAGYSFISMSDEAATAQGTDLSPYCAADIILGEERTTPMAFMPGVKEFQIYSPSFLDLLSAMREKSLPVLISGAYIGTETAGDTTVQKTVAGLLHFKLRTDHAVKTGRFYATDAASPFFSGTLAFDAGDSGTGLYAAESADAIEPADKSAFTAFRYTENNTSAVVAFPGSVRTVVMGLPFETIPDSSDRDALMVHILDFLLNRTAK